MLFVGTLWASPSQDPAPQNQPSAGEDTRAAQATPESTISSKEAKELFRSVDEILQFASQDTGLPIKNEVKRRLTKRSEVQHYIQKSMKEDKDAKRLERSSAVLKKFGLLPRLRPAQISGDDAARASCGILRRQNENRKSAQLGRHRAAKTSAGTRTDARSPGSVLWDREMDAGIEPSIRATKKKNKRPQSVRYRKR